MSKQQKNKNEEMSADQVESVAAEAKSEAKEKKKSDEKAALERVLKALDMSEAQLKELEASRAAAEELMDYDVTPTVVRINGVHMPMKGRLPRSQVEAIMAAAAARRNRILGEALGKTTLGELVGSQFFARAVKTESIEGQEVSNA